MKLAVLFPGIGYHCDKPLLYYTKKILKNKGYQIHEIQFTDLDFDLVKSKDKAYQQALQQVEAMAFSTFDSVLFVSKSIGTYCAARLAKEYHLTSNIYFTPLDFTPEFLSPNDLVFSGTQDQWASYAYIEEYCKKHQIPLHSILDGNHSLETGNIQTDLTNLREVMKQVEAYIHN